MDRKIRLGLMGLCRGGFARDYCNKMSNVQLVAVCDLKAEKFAEYENAGIKCFTDFDEFIKEDMDGVVLANFANQHAPFAIKALRAGKSVLSEVLPFQNLKEGIELIETIEQTGLVYAYSENYCYMSANMEMKKLLKEGKLGTFEYGEGEYLHNCEPGWENITGLNGTHWRNMMCSTFYCTHSLGPMIHITGQRPVKVTGFELPYNARAERMRLAGAPAAIEMVELESGALIKSIHGVAISKNSYWFSCYGSRGRAECAREATGEHVNVEKLYTNLDASDGQCTYFQEKMYYPSVENQDLASIAHSFGHGGGDFWVMYNFIEKLLGNENDSIGIYEACDMFVPGMFAYRSILAGGIPMDIPDLRDPAQRDKWRNDTACTDTKAAGDMLLPPRKGL